MNNTLIFHMCRRDEWLAAVEAGSYGGSSQDVADGFIHFSTAEQIVASAARHRKGQDGLLLLAVDPDSLGTSLRWEPASNGALFPHVYGGLPAPKVIWARDLPLGPDGLHRFPSLEGSS